MKSIKLAAEDRASGAKTAKKLRKEGRVPCVMYGGEKNFHFSVNSNALDKVINTPEVFQVVIDLAGTEYNSVIKDMQFHPVSDKTVHIDFIQLFNDKKVTVQLPVSLEGTSPGVKIGGRLMLNKRRVNVKGFPGDLPDNIAIDISELAIGDKVKVSALELAGLELLEPLNDVIVGVKTSRKVAAVEEEVTAETTEEAPAAE